MNSLNYIGSKYSLYPVLKPTFEKIINKFNRPVVFGDLFAGTGIVGYNIGSEFDTKIIANDIQYYSYVINRANLSVYTDEDIRQINKYVIEYNKLDGIHGFIYTNYSKNESCERMYFSNENAMKIDAIRTKIKEDKQKMNDNVYYYLLANLISSADKVANTSCVYGAYLKELKKSASKNLVMHNFDNNTKQVHVQGDVFCENISDIKTPFMDIVYLDPPYNNRQYASNYHILETIALDDTPEIHGKTGLRNYTSQKSDFCIKKLVYSRMEELISKLNARFITISYNDEGLIDKQHFCELLEKFGKLEIIEIDYKKFKAQTTVERSETVEYLFVLEKDY
jgi:adenine-specific DNA-methyltransferase